MKNFNYYQPTEIRFGWGRTEETGEAAAGYGKNCLIVTTPLFPEIEPAFKKVMDSLKAAHVKTVHYDGVIPNPTADVVSRGVEVAKEHGCDVILGLGGGSSMDTAKAIAVEAVHEGTCWDYLWFRDKQPSEKTLPVIAVTTTSGTGSHVTQVAVVTNTDEKCKSAVYNANVFPRTGIVDPELMLTVPKHITAVTGFDVFTHAFESYIHANASPYTDMMALEALRLTVRYLPEALENGSNRNARNAMAWADTLAGLCIANAGVTLPHGMGMAIGGMYPHIAHGEALAVLYPSFMRYTYRSAVRQFAHLGRMLNTELVNISDEDAAEKSCEEVDTFLKKIGLWVTLDSFDVPENELPELAESCLVLPDYKNNPKVADLKDMSDLLSKSYKR